MSPVTAIPRRWCNFYFCATTCLWLGLVRFSDCALHLLGCSCSTCSVMRSVIFQILCLYWLLALLSTTLSRWILAFEFHRFHVPLRCKKHVCITDLLTSSPKENVIQCVAWHGLYMSFFGSVLAFLPAGFGVPFDVTKVFVFLSHSCTFLGSSVSMHASNLTMHSLSCSSSQGRFTVTHLSSLRRKKYLSTLSHVHKSYIFLECSKTYTTHDIREWYCTRCTSLCGVRFLECLTHHLSRWQNVYTSVCLRKYPAYLVCLIVCYSEPERKEEAKKRLEKRLENRENT